MDQYESIGEKSLLQFNVPFENNDEEIFDDMENTDWETLNGMDNTDWETLNAMDNTGGGTLNAMSFTDGKTLKTMDNTDGETLNEMSILTRNSSMTDYERQEVTKRTAKGITSRIELVEVRHGTMLVKDTEEVNATLLVLRLRFDPEMPKRRVIQAKVHVEFRTSSKIGKDPVVHAIAPEQRRVLNPTADSQKTTFTLGFGTDKTYLFKWDQEVTKELNAATSISGSIDIPKGRDFGPRTVATWTLVENSRRKTGVPDSAQVAILVRREDNEPFEAEVTFHIKSKVDVLSKMQGWFARVPLDDPVLFNPKGAKVVEHKDLHKVDLSTLCPVGMGTALPLY